MGLLLQDIPINRTRNGNTFALSKFFETEVVKCIIEMQELGIGENASRIKQVGFHLSQIAATICLVVGI
jgi:hypothetical protein